MKSTIKKVDIINDIDIFEVTTDNPNFRKVWFVYLPEDEYDVQLGQRRENTYSIRFVMERVLTSDMFADWLGTTKDKLIDFVTSGIETITFENNNK